MMSTGPARRAPERRSPSRRRTDRVRLGLFVGLYVLGLAALLVGAIRFQASTNHQNEVTRAVVAKIAQVLKIQSTNRILVARDSCREQTKQAYAINRTPNFLGKFIVASTVATKPFTATYEQFGLPSYADRLHQAQHIQHRLRVLRVHPPNCKKRINSIKLAAAGKHP